MKKQPGILKNTLIHFLDSMTKVSSKERFFDSAARKKFGKAWKYGEKIYGQSTYGDEEIEVPVGKGFAGPRWGIYQKRTENGKSFTVREKFYIPSDPKSAGQLAQRTKFKNGMTAWNNLTTEQKESYNKEGSKIGQMGQNIFLKQYLNSN